MYKPSPQLAGQAREPLWLPTVIIMIASSLLLLLMLYVTALDLRIMVGHLKQLADPNLSAAMRTALDVESAAEAIKVLLDLYLLAVLAFLTIMSLRYLAMRESRIDVTHFLDIAPRLLLTRNVGQLRYWLVGILLVRTTLRLIQQTLRLPEPGMTDFTYLPVLVVLLIGVALVGCRPRSRSFSHLSRDPSGRSLNAKRSAGETIR